MKAVLIFIFFVGVSISSHAQSNDSLTHNCKLVFAEGNILKYKDPKYSDTRIKIKNGFHNEYYGQSNVKLKSSITWLSDCQVKIELIKVKRKTNYSLGQYLILEIYYLSEN